MNSYKIYLTKSAETAYLISRGLREATPWSKEGGATISISHGGASANNNKIPPCYQRVGYHYAMIEYRNGPDDSCPEYSLVIC